ncbi:MAG TPA: hypothetical protein PKJ41_21460, partial [Bryobacteraceae bacterium]|nr:hypothetical protein [Bryobacteraceae bacterium]
SCCWATARTDRRVVDAILLLQTERAPFYAWSWRFGLGVTVPRPRATDMYPTQRWPKPPGNSNAFDRHVRRADRRRILRAAARG